MKVIIIEGSPEELADYEARTGMIGQREAGANALGHAGEPLSTGDGEASSGDDLAMVWSFIFWIWGWFRETY